MNQIPMRRFGLSDQHVTSSLWIVPGTSGREAQVFPKSELPETVLKRVTGWCDYWHWFARETPP